MDAIRWKGNALSLLDQTRLPVEEVWLDYTDYRPVADAIRTMVVRGAPAIGVTAAYAYCLAALAGEDLDQARAVLGKRIKRLGVHLVLLEGRTPEEAAAFPTGKKAAELSALCQSYGF